MHLDRKIQELLVASLIAISPSLAYACGFSSAEAIYPLDYLIVGVLFGSVSVGRLYKQGVTPSRRQQLRRLGTWTLLWTALGLVFCTRLELNIGGFGALGAAIGTAALGAIMFPAWRGLRHTVLLLCAVASFFGACSLTTLTGTDSKFEPEPEQHHPAPTPPPQLVF